MITRVFIVVFVAIVCAGSTQAKTLVLRHATAFVEENLARQADCTIEIDRAPEEKIENTKSVSMVIKAGEVFDPAKLLAE